MRTSVYDTIETFGYGFKFPDTGHWQSGPIDQPVKCELMQDISKLRLQTGFG